MTSFATEVTPTLFGQQLDAIAGINLKNYGTIGNGIANDYAAFVAADAAATAAGAPLIIPTGTYRLNTSYQPTSNLVFTGGVIKPASGTTFTVVTALTAPCIRLFDLSLSGTVNLNAAKMAFGYFEWYGVIANSSAAAANNAAWMNAALIATPWIIALGLDYYHSATIKHLTPNHNLQGASSLYDATYGTHATRFLVTNGSDHTLQIGLDSNPGSIGQLPQGLKCSGISAARSVAPVASSGCTAIRVQYLVHAIIHDMRGDESMLGWEFNGCVDTDVDLCFAKRTSAGTGGADSWVGFYVNGSSGIGAGGNASLYLKRCNSSDTRSVKTTSTGFKADQEFSDFYWIDCETSQCTVGMECHGNSSASNDNGNVDARIVGAVNDAFATYGIWIHGFGVSGSIDIVNPYCGPALGATDAIHIDNCTYGTVTVTGGQMVMGSAPLCKGITVDTCRGVSILGTQIIEAGSNGAVVLTGASNCRIMPTVKNKITTCGAAVELLNTCVGNYIAPIAIGKVGAFPIGINVIGTADDRNEYNCTGIDSAAVATSSANKLVRNSVQITAANTLTGTNTTSGVMT